MEPTRKTHSFLFILTLFMAVCLAGCSDSPTDPVEAGPVAVKDIPDIPQPTTPGGDVPAASATVTRIAKLGGVFRPNILDAYGSWEGSKRCTNGDRQFLTTVYGWSSEARSDPDFGILAASLPGRNIAFQDASGDEKFPVFTRDYTSFSSAPLSPAVTSAVYRGGKFGTPVHVRRDRRWELKPLEGNAGDYLLVNPQTTGEVASAYTSGIERGQTIEFGKSLTVGAGVGIGPLSVSVEGTLSETFSSSVTVSESKQETFTKSVSGKSGKVLQSTEFNLP